MAGICDGRSGPVGWEGPQLVKRDPQHQRDQQI